MIIGRIRAGEVATESRVECEVRFERRTQRAHDIYAVTGSTHKLTADPNGFLLGGFLPAWVAGERRIRIEDPVCPLLVANLRIVSSLMKGWFKDLGPVPVIECDYESREAGTEVAAFMSGGVDSLAMLRNLTTLRPLGHPDRPTAAVIVDFPYLDGIDRKETDARFLRSMATCREISSSLGLDIIGVTSNFCELNPSMAFWIHRYHGAFLASMAHFLSGRYRRFHIASSYPMTHLVPWGSHPQLDPYYSSQHVAISHDGAELSRLEKVRRLCDWPMALNRMYVCTSRSSDGRNCGACEKCVRTKLHLLLEGRLGDAAAFAENDVSEADVAGIRIGSAYASLCYEEALPGLQRLGRRELTRAVERAIRDFRRNNLTRGLWTSSRVWAWRVKGLMRKPKPR